MSHVVYIYNNNVTNEYIYIYKEHKSLIYKDILGVTLL